MPPDVPVVLFGFASHHHSSVPSQRSTRKAPGAPESCLDQSRWGCPVLMLSRLQSGQSLWHHPTLRQHVVSAPASDPSSYPGRQEEAVMLSLRKVSGQDSSTSLVGQGPQVPRGNPLPTTAARSAVPQLRGWSWHGGPTLRVKPVALLLNLYTPWAGTGARPGVELKGRLGLFPSWPGLLPLRDPEAGASGGGGG